MSRERAERLAAALGVTVEVKRPSPRSQWRVYVDGMEWRATPHGETFAWELAQQVLNDEAAAHVASLSRALAREQWHKRDAEEAAHQLAKATKEKAAADARAKDSAAAFAAALADATPLQRAVWAALTEGA